jgi:hypothetical protein
MTNSVTSFAGKTGRAIGEGLRKAVRTSWFLLRIMVPLSLLVAVLGWSGFLARIATLFAPLMKLIGLPGEAALAFLSGALLNNYSAIAVMGSLELNMKHATILAVMSLVCHNLLIETAVMKKSGSSAATMVALRLAAAIFLAWALSLLIPDSLSRLPFSAASDVQRPSFGGMLSGWASNTGILTVKIILIVVAIMVVQRLLDEFRVMRYLSRAFAPLMGVFGLPRSASFLWLVINGVGYAYGAGIILAEIEAGTMKPQESDLFNHHAAITHSLLEDSFLYVALSIPIFWLVLPRIILSIAIVWLERLRRHVFRRSFRVGTV